LGESPVPQSCTQFLGDASRVDAIANDPRPDENDELSAFTIYHRLANRPAEVAELIDDGNARAVVILTVADKACQ
jgi:hypothetical protein